MTPAESLESVLEQAPSLIVAATNGAELDAAEIQLLGKDSELGQIRSSMGKLDASDRPLVGAKLQEVTAAINDLLQAKRHGFELEAEIEKVASERIDVTLESLHIPQGSLHIIQQTIDEIVDIFLGLGYRVAEGPDAELAYYNFDALNTPATHPSRLESDTMYLDYGAPEDEILLRTQTSPVQVRWMEQHDPPVYVVVPGKCYRLDAIDATHLPVFHQIEGLAVDENIQFSDLKGTLLHFAWEYFGPSTDVRLRPHFFPFTEPSAELDVSCFNCDRGEPDCRVCRGEGWIEMLGCGMVDPNVLTGAGYDPSQVSGFAFGMGVERPAMVKYGITDMRTFIENDRRFLGQFL